jgi:hypothetical protein
MAPNSSNPLGSTGNLVLAYTINPPSMAGCTTEADGFWYGEWSFQSFLSTCTISTNDYQNGGVDLSTLTGQTRNMLILVGSRLAAVVKMPELTSRRKYQLIGFDSLAASRIPTSLRPTAPRS